MTDFFTNLLNRAANQAPVLQWRRPSLFESQAGAAAQNDPASAEKESVVDSTSSHRMNAAIGLLAAPSEQRMAVRQEATPSQSWAIEKARAPETFVQHIASEMPSIKPASEAAQVVRHETTTLVHLEKTVIKEMLAPVPPVSKEGGTRQGIEPIQPSIIEKPRNEQSDDANTLKRLASLQPVPVAAVHAVPKIAPARSDAIEPIRKPSRKFEDGPHMQQSKAIARPALLQPQRQPALASPVRPQPVAVRMPPATPPSVQVTIGRIEVRANHAPAVSRGARSAAPKMGLDDYLRSRSGGGK